MAALTANADRKRTAVRNTLRGSAGAAASTTLYKHGLISLDNSGNAIATAGSSTNCVGYAKQKVDNSSGAAGDKTVTYFYNDAIEITSSSVTQGHVNKTLYAKDDNTVVPTATTGPAVGVLKKLSGTTATVLVGVWEDKDGT